MFRRILIANRGEIAVRIIRACRAGRHQHRGIFLGRPRLPAYVACGRASASAPRRPRRAICISRASSPRRDLRCARHSPELWIPGGKPQICAHLPGLRHRIHRPDAGGIALSGDKAACRAKVKAVSVPVVPGSDGLLEDPRSPGARARIGFPVLVKASAGGAGKACASPTTTSP